jgi:hypothetical protein
MRPNCETEIKRFLDAQTSARPPAPGKCVGILGAITVNGQGLFVIFFLPSVTGTTEPRAALTAQDP